MNKLILSTNLFSLAEKLSHFLKAKGKGSLQTQTILVPNKEIKNWLLLQIAIRNQVAMGLKVVTPEAYFQSDCDRLNLFCEVYSILKESKNEEVCEFLRDFDKRRILLAQELSSLFSKYDLYEWNLTGKESFQFEILKKIKEKDFKMRAGKIEEPLARISHTISRDDVPDCTDSPRECEKCGLILFAIDFLPPAYWKLIFSAPSVHIYLFSPSAFYLEDGASRWERKQLKKAFKKKEIQDLFDFYMDDVPDPIANWGRLGRLTLKILDGFEFHTEELYPSLNPTTALKELQHDLIYFEKREKFQEDDSIQVLLAGSSKLEEIKAVKEEILKLALPLKGVLVLAPDIEPYVPLIEYVFEKEVPFRISGVDQVPQSFYRQALFKLLSLSSGRWEKEDVLTLFENPAFYLKKGWDEEDLEAIRFWISEAKISWGADCLARDTHLKRFLEEGAFSHFGSWESGLDRLLDSLIYPSDLELDGDLFEELIETFESLKALVSTKMMTLKEWAHFLKKLEETFLVLDTENRADEEAERNLHQMIDRFYESDRDDLFPLEVIEHFLKTPLFSSINPSHLHAVHFATFKDAAQIPAEALFLIGMDETSFPTLKRKSSLDLLKKKIAPESSDIDRYLFLQTLFSAREFLRISYCHISEEEGKPVSPSILVKELIELIGNQIELVKKPTKPFFHKKNLVWPSTLRSLFPKEPLVIHFSELRSLARHPWKFYLQKAHGIYLEEKLEDSFALQKAKILRKEAAASDFFQGPFQEALLKETAKTEKSWEALFKEWEITPFSVEFRKSALSAEFEGATFVAPALHFEVENVSIQLVGTIPYATEKGLAVLGKDTISSAIRAWPDALAIGTLFHSSGLFFLKSGKKKTVLDPMKNLGLFLKYYFYASSAPSPLIPDWIDPFLRKGKEGFEKAAEKTSLFEDPVMNWVLARAELGSSSEIFENWEPVLKETFEDLSSLYPTREAR